MAEQLALEPSRDAFIEKQAHEHELLHVFKHAQRQGLFDGRKVVQEFSERSAVFQVIEQRPSRHTRADKNGRSPEDVGIRMHAGNLALHASTSRDLALPSLSVVSR